jgi:hypothetical protein
LAEAPKLPVERGGSGNVQSRPVVSRLQYWLMET